MAAKLESKYYLRLIAFAAAEQVKHHSMLRSPVRQALSSRFAAKVEPKHYSVLIPFVRIKVVGHCPMYNLKQPLH